MMRETDLAIIGAGTAGLTAALTAAQQGLDVLVIERMGAGGQVMNVERIANYPGFPQGISGFDLGPLLQEQAEAAGAEFMLDEVQAIEPRANGRFVLRCGGEEISARAVLVATGSARRRLDVPGEHAFEGRGVSHCASCDGPLFRGEDLCVVGGGDSAFSEAAVLAAHARAVTLVFREERPRAQHYLVEALAAMPNVTLLPRSTVAEILGEQGVCGVRLTTAGDASRVLAVQGVFVYAGLVADSAFPGPLLGRDPEGRIATDAHMRTGVPGIFAAGDIRAGSSFLLATAAAEGATAALAVHRYLEEGR